MTRESFFKDSGFQPSDFDERGRHICCGKFEGETIATAIAYYLFLNGDPDWTITEEDLKEFPELAIQGFKVGHINHTFENDNGFIYLHQGTEEKCGICQDRY